MPLARIVIFRACSCKSEKSLDPNRLHERSLFKRRLVAAKGARALSAAATCFKKGSGSKASEIADVAKISGCVFIAFARGMKTFRNRLVNWALTVSGNTATEQTKAMAEWKAIGIIIVFPT